MAEITEQIVREAPLIEDLKVGLMKSAQALPAAALPAYQIQGMSQDQLDAMQRGRMGIGAYSPYLQAGTGALGNATGTLGEAANVLRGADTRGQFAAAQQAYNLAAQPAAAIGNLSNVAGSGIGQIAQGSRDIDIAQRMAASGTQGYNPYSAAEYMNPYTQAVIGQSLEEINRQGDLSRQNLQAQAVKAGAFGGSREGVQRAELERNLSQTRNQAILGALQQGYGSAQQQAQQAFEQQQGRQLNAAGAIGQMGATQAGLAGLYSNIAGQQANILGQQSQLQQQLGQGIGNLAQQQFGIGQGMAQGLGSLGTQLGNLGVQQAGLGQQAQAMGQQDVNFQYNLGAQQQRQGQAELDALRATRTQEALQPQQRLAFLSDIYKGAPSTQMAVTQQQTPTASPFQQVAGLGIAGLSAAAAGSRAGIL
jgi:hypothetical protein